MSSGATFVKIDKMKHSPDGDYSLVIEGNTVLVPLFHMYLALLFLNTFTFLIHVFQIPPENLSFLPLCESNLSVGFPVNKNSWARRSKRF